MRATSSREPEPVPLGPQTAPMFGAVRAAQWPLSRFGASCSTTCCSTRSGIFRWFMNRRELLAESSLVNPSRRSSPTNGGTELWASYYDHPDPAHNAPSAEETVALERWAEAHAEYKRSRGEDRARGRDALERTLALYPAHSLALTDLAHRIVGDALGGGDLEQVDEARERAVDLLRRALLVDPTSFHANLRMAWNCGHLERYTDARHHLARAVRYARLSVAGLSALGDAHADWGFLSEAESYFEKALALEPERPRTLRDYARAVWDLGAHTAEETARAVALFERALAAGPDDHLSHLSFAFALATLPGESVRALHHAERALALRPDRRTPWS